MLFSYKICDEKVKSVIDRINLLYIYIPLGSWDAAKTNGVDKKLFAFSSSLTMEKHVILLLLIFWSLHLNSLNISSLNLVKKLTNAKRQFISLFCQ